MSEKEIRAVEDYVVQNALSIGGTEVVLAEKKGAEHPYMVCNCTWDNSFGLETYSGQQVSNDYLDILREFLGRADGLLAAFEKEREETGLPLQPLGEEHCIPGSMAEHFKDKLVIIKAERMSPEYRSAEHQLMICQIGNGLNPTARGTSVYGDYLYSGKPTVWQRDSIAGIADPAKLPEWAQQRLAEIQHTKGSIIEQISVGKKKASEQANNTPPKAKGGQEL